MATDMYCQLLAKHAINKLNSMSSIIGNPTRDINPKIYHTRISMSGDSYEVIVGNVVYFLQHVSAGIFSLSIRSSGKSFLVDVKRTSQYDLTGVEGSTFNSLTLNTTNQSLDAVIYTNSNEMHRTWIRQQDPDTNLWSLHEVNLFPSSNGNRIDIWVYKIYEDISY